VRPRRGAAGRGELDCMNLHVDYVQGSGGGANGAASGGDGIGCASRGSIHYDLEEKKGSGRSAGSSREG
jgi:hypothetical protein